MAVTYKIHPQHDNVVVMIFHGTKNSGNGAIDLIDLERVQKHSWYIKDASTTKKGYIAAKINGKTVKLHRFILDAAEDVLVDHKNRNPWDCRRINLKFATYSENNRNISLSKNNTSGKTGVHRSNARGNRSAKWVAQWQIDGKKMSKNFSVSVYGEENAEKMAREHIEKIHRELGFTSE